MFFRQLFFQNKRHFYGYLFVIPILTIVLFSLPLLQSVLLKTEYHGRWVNESAPSWSEISLVSDHSVQTQSLAGLAQEFVWVYFGYLHCDGFCQQQWVTLFHLMQSLPAEPTHVLLVSIDPKRDHPAEFTALAKELGHQVIPFIPDNLQKAQALANRFHQPFHLMNPISEESAIAHAGDIFLIAPDGRIKLIYNGNHWRYDQLKEDYFRLKKEMQL
jgi:cytochrome oxidase Cu insertion factor (SCO1/SenC/PrrC family)